MNNFWDVLIFLLITIMILAPFILLGFMYYVTFA